MFAYLSKKIGMPNNIPVESLAWSQDQGFLGVGGQNGLLKIIKFDEKKPQAGVSQPSANLAVNHTLASHSGSVKIIGWNESYRKLTTADENGLIIVWMTQQDHWYEEMINNRNKSKVTDLKWSPDGTRICIVYEDGAVIVGSVEGNRLWGKELKHQLHLIEWSPDNKMILFSTPSGEIKAYDNSGSFLFDLKIYCLQDIVGPAKIYNPEMKLAAIQWYSGSKMYTDETPPGLLIAYENGRIQLMRNDKDDVPIIMDSYMSISTVRWNPNGTMFAVAGYRFETKDNQQTKQGVVQFFNNQGYHLRALTVQQCEKIAAVAWEGTGLKISMAAGSSIYYANIKPDYKWGYMNTANTVVVAHQKGDRIDNCITFWNLKAEKKHLKYVKNLHTIKTCGEYCVIITKIDEQNEQYAILLCNAIGSLMETKYISIEPSYVAMTKTHVVVCSTNHVYVWQYRNQVSRLTTFETNDVRASLSTKKFGRELAFFIDEEPNPNNIYDKDKYSKEGKVSNDGICAVTASESILIVGRSSGSLHKYGLPHVTMESKMYMKGRPYLLEINCSSSRLSLVDISGTLSLMEFAADGASTLLDYTKNEVWQTKWSEDNEMQIAFMEKSRMYTMKGVEPEEPVTTEAYICDFSDLQIKCILLDDIMKVPDQDFKTSELVIDFETKSLRDTRDIINTVNLKEAFAYVEQNPHIRLWKLLAEKSLEMLDFNYAAKAFAQCEDYQSLQLVKRLQLIDDKNVQKAEILAHHGNYDEAENLLLKLERRDLAIQLRMKIGDWFKVVQLIKEGFGNDDLLMQAYKKIGDYYSDRFKWGAAANYYSLCKHYEGLAEAYFNMEDYDSLEKLLKIIPESSPMLIDLGDKFQAIGMCDAAVDAYQRGGNVKKALDCCILLNQWNLAVELAEKNNFMQIEALLTTYANHLLEKRKKLECVELYRRANRNTEAARMLSQIANDLTEKNANPIVIKKLYVMAALEVDSYKKKMIEATLTGQGNTTAKTLDSLITSDINTSTEKALTNPWRGAEAWHFSILCQRQLYNLDFKSALKTALRLSEYELELGTKAVYSLIALAAIYAKHFRDASRAFVKLEALKELTDAERERYSALAVNIFSKYAPRNPECETLPCIGKNCDSTITEFDTHCNKCGSNFQPCALTGAPIFEKNYYSCKGCKKKSKKAAILKLNVKYCPLCHLPIDTKQLA